MRIIFVRHGEPDYLHDCLTQTGHKQAAAAAQRLADEGITEVYASSCGRAFETASYTALLLDLPVVKLDFMREISWGGFRIPCGGHPWALSETLLDEGFDFGASDWRKHAFFDGNIATEEFEKIAACFDEFLLGQGFRHENGRFFCESGTNKTIALFSHGGSGACALSHLLGLPFPYVAAVMPYDFTSITIVDLPATENAYTHPTLELFNDCAHIHRMPGGPSIQQVSSDKLEQAEKEGGKGPESLV